MDKIFGCLGKTILFFFTVYNVVVVLALSVYTFTIDGTMFWLKISLVIVHLIFIALLYKPVKRMLQ